MKIFCFKILILLNCGKVQGILFCGYFKLYISSAPKPAAPRAAPPPPSSRPPEAVSTSSIPVAAIRHAQALEAATVKVLTIIFTLFKILVCKMFDFQ